MSVLVVGLVLIGIISFLLYYLQSNDVGDSTIPYAKYQSYPIIGHLIPFLGCRAKLLTECRQRYGECFRIRVFSQYFTMISSHTDWTNVVRSQSFEFAGIDFAVKIFDVSPTFLSEYLFLKLTHRKLRKMSIISKVNQN
jgi:hypothetical protein